MRPAFATLIALITLVGCGGGGATGGSRGTGVPAQTTSYATTLTDSNNATMTTATLVINPDASFTLTSTGAVPFTASGTVFFPPSSTSGSITGTIVFSQPVNWNGAQVRQDGSYSLGGEIDIASASAYTGALQFRSSTLTYPSANFRASNVP